jgi:hypothetical protein
MGCFFKLIRHAPNQNLPKVEKIKRKTETKNDISEKFCQFSRRE